MGTWTVQTPGIYFSSLCYLGLASATYFLGKRMFCMGRRIAKYWQSIGNSKKFLMSKPSDEFLDTQRKSNKDQESQQQQP